MIPISLEQVAIMAEGLLIQGNPKSQIQSVHFDSRLLEKDSLFVPISGQRDGHDFLMQAVSSGAKAAFVSDQTKIPAELPHDFGLILVNETLRAFQKLAFAYRRQFTFPFVAVTGSIGKTSTRDIIAHLLSVKIPLYRSYKNFNNHLGVPYSLLKLNHSYEAAVLELGMNHAGEIDLLASMVLPQISVITYIGDSHIEYFGSRDKIALAKAELLPHTAPDGLVLLNGDNQYLRKISHLYSGEIQYYSVTGPADIWAEEIESDERGTRFTVHFGSGESFPVYLSLFGEHNVLNALPAIAIARRFGLTPDEIAQGLSTVSLTGMRFEVVHSASGALIVNDAYNASPASMEASISTFAGLFPERKKVLVLGDMYELGEESAHMHEELGRFASQYKERFSLLIAIGPLMQHLYDTYQGEKLYFADKESALPTILQLDTKDHAVLFKASRGVMLETIVKEFQV